MREDKSFNFLEGDIDWLIFKKLTLYFNDEFCNKKYYPFTQLLHLMI
jgi:hypothetical protein